MFRARQGARPRLSPLMRSGAAAAGVALLVSGGAYAAVLGTGPGMNPLTEAQARIGALVGEADAGATAPAVDVSTTQVVIETVTEDVADPHSTVEQQSATLPEGTTEVQTAGVDGVVRTTYQIVTEGGVEISREPVSSVVVTPRVDEVVLVGTAGTSSAPGGSASGGSASGGSAIVADGSVWASLAQCESGGNPHINTGNGFYGAFQFTLPTWQAMGGTGYPHEHSYETQLAMAQQLQARSGWGQWPGCAAKLGLL